LYKRPPFNTNLGFFLGVRHCTVTCKMHNHWISNSRLDDIVLQLNFYLKKHIYISIYLTIHIILYIFKHKIFSFSDFPQFDRKQHGIKSKMRHNCPWITWKLNSFPVSAVSQEYDTAFSSMTHIQNCPMVALV
jgi:hypothetical protein